MGDPDVSEELRDALEKKVKTLVESCWYRRVNWVQVESWLENFTGLAGDVDKERLHALYLLAWACQKSCVSEAMV